MTAHAEAKLPDAVAGALVTLAGTLDGVPTEADVDACIANLGELPAQLIGQASGYISGAVQRVDWPKEKGPSVWPLFRSKSSKPTPAALLSERPGLAWLLMFHRDGYIREAALRAIREPPASPFFVAAIAWRLNDWVEQVRDAASLCAGRVFPAVDADTGAGAAFYLLDRRLTWGRWDKEQALLDLLLGRPDILARVALQIRGESTGGLAGRLRHLLRYPAIDAYLPGLLAEAVEPAVRAVALKCLIERRVSWPTGFAWRWIDKVYGVRKRVLVLDHRGIMAPFKADVVARGLSDRAAIVRRVAADAVIADPSSFPDIQEIIARMASDKSAAIRARAEFMVRTGVPVNN